MDRGYANILFTNEECEGHFLILKMVGGMTYFARKSLVREKHLLLGKPMEILLSRDECYLLLLIIFKHKNTKYLSISGHVMFFLLCSS